MALRLTSQSLARGAVARRPVSARPRPLQQRGALFQGCTLRRRTSTIVIATRGESEIDAEVQVAEQLGNKLSMLDETLEALQTQLEVGEAGQEEDQQLLLKLVDEVKKEQEAWIEETQVMDKLLKGAAHLDTSEAELVAMTKQHEVMKRKVEMFTGLLQERAREVGALRCQLQDIQQMGEMKEMKLRVTESEDMVAAGGAPVETEAEVFAAPTSTAFTQVPGFEGFGARRPPAGVASSRTSENIPEEVAGSPESPESPEPEKESVRESKPESPKVKIAAVAASLRTVGMEAPGLVIATVFLGAGQLFSLLWRGVKGQIPDSLRVGVEVASCAGAAVAAVSLASTAPL